MDHISFGLADETAATLGRSAWLAGLVRYLVQQPEPVRLAGLPRGGCLLLPRRTPCRRVVARGRPGKPDPLPGVLYLIRSPDVLAFRAEDEQTVRVVADWLKQGNLAEEVICWLACGSSASLRRRPPAISTSVGCSRSL
ncbi:MAG: hypothetical protein U0736_27410 [Gemmataceae bacterium]